MANQRRENPAILIIDMVKDNFDEKRKLPITPLAKKIIPPINRLTESFRSQGWSVVFSTDAFSRNDFIFTGSMKPHSLAGTPGAELTDQLIREQDDLLLPKPRFSAFFRTDFDQWLREKEVTLCAVAGIATHFCVLTTALDAISSDFKAVILEDCTAAPTETIHEKTLNIYRRNPLYPLLRVATSEQILAEMTGD